MLEVSDNLTARLYLGEGCVDPACPRTRVLASQAPSGLPPGAEFDGVAVDYEISKYFLISSVLRIAEEVMKITGIDFMAGNKA